MKLATLTLEKRLSAMPRMSVMQALLQMVEDLTHGQDEITRALGQEAAAVGAKVVLVGGAAVNVHGYERTTKDRDYLVDHRHVRELAERLMDSADWERLEIREYSFCYLPTGMTADLLVSRNLVTLGRPYYFPDIDQLETFGAVEGVPVIGLHDLLYLKLLSGRMKDLADVMELVKRHLNEVQSDRVLSRIDVEDPDLRQTFLDILAKAPVELANEQRLGQ